MATKNIHKREKTSITNFENFASFSDIGGLSDHIKILKELIIFPLIYQNVYNKFKIRPARGVIFHGPPGTGKTLVAGALAKECSKEINKKISFFNRKGADILNKWVGESEEKLRSLFAEAEECHPSIIFFDEIDGLAPTRSSKQDQVHASVVATLLALMDGLDKIPGVVVIGATNRIDTIDPALRRPGRFDRELYFPLPAYNARREIFEVHVNSWTVKPKPSFLSYLSDITVGYSGSDIEALCTEAVMSCLRRNYPEIHNYRLSVKTRNLKVNENDFMIARQNIMPSINREGNTMRRLSTFIQPLLQRQLTNVLMQMESISPHFVDSNFKYQIGSQRYGGRLLLVGNPQQGHNTHLVPAILHALEHLPSYVIDIQALYKCANSTAEEICVQKLTQARINLPSILLAYRLDEWWDIVEESTRAILVSMLKDLNADLPLLVIATATNDLPSCLAAFFSEPGSIIYEMESPDNTERENYFYSLFMENALNKCKCNIRTRNHKCEVPNIYAQEYISAQCRRLLNNKRNKELSKIFEDRSNNLPIKRKHSNVNFYPIKHQKKSDPNISCSSKEVADVTSSTWTPLFNIAYKIKESLTKSILNEGSKSSELSNDSNSIKKHFVNKNYVDDYPSVSMRRMTNIKNLRQRYKRKVKRVVSYDDFIIPGDSEISNVDRIKYLFRRAVSMTSKDMDISQLELLYDMLATCINRENQEISTMLENIGNILSDFERKTEATIDY